MAFSRTLFVNRTLAFFNQSRVCFKIDFTLSPLNALAGQFKIILGFFLEFLVFNLESFPLVYHGVIIFSVFVFLSFSPYLARRNIFLTGPPLKALRSNSFLSPYYDELISFFAVTTWSPITPT